MRIIYVTSSLPHGKKEAFIIPEVTELKRRGQEVLIVPTYPRGEVLHGDVKALLSDVASVPLVSLGIAKAAVRQFARNAGPASRTLGYLFRSRSIGVLMRNLAIYSKGLWLADVARAWGADHIHAHWATVPATMALVAGEVSGVPWSLTAHRFDIAEDNLLDIKARKACFIRAISQWGAQEIADCVSPGAPTPSVIHMGVRLPSVKPRELPGNNGRGLRLVVPANLLEVKGHAFLLQAVRMLTARGIDVHLDLAGDGPLREDLVRETQDLGLEDRVTFLGLVPHERLLRRLETGSWDILVLPSIVTNSGEKEGIPVALIEAMSCRVPVVSTLTGGIPELFEGVDGAFLVPPRNTAALAEAIERIASHPGLRERFVEAASKRVEDSFAVEQVAEELVRRFEICGTRRR
jgi:colanic acid/amylovoran biosynthesis glycosyltransferase